MVNDNLKMHSNGCGIPKKSWQFFYILTVLQNKNFFAKITN